MLDRSIEVKFSALLGNYRRTNHPTNGQTSLPTDRPISIIIIDENLGKQANAADVTDLKGEWVRQRARGDVNARVAPHVKIIALVITVFPIDQRNFRFGFSLCAQSIDLSLFVFCVYLFHQRDRHQDRETTKKINFKCTWFPPKNWKNKSWSTQ